MQHVLVTGGNGFIGGYVCEELERRGYRVAVLDRRGDRTPGGPATEFTPWHVVFGDIKDSTLVDEAVSHTDAVIHLAGVLGTQETIADPRPAAETNILGGLHVITACTKYDVPLVNIAVGNWWMNNTYSITKNSIERFVEMKATFEKARMCSVRALNAYGPRQVPAAPYGPSRVRKIMPSFICKALSGEPIEVYGDGTQVMDMIHVTDVARVLVTTLEHVDRGDTPTATVEAGTGRPTTVNDIAWEVANGTPLREMSEPIKHIPMRPGEPERSVVLADTKTLGQVGINPDDFVALEDGVEMTISYFKEYMKNR